MESWLSKSVQHWEMNLREDFSKQNSDLLKGLNGACTFICWDFIEAFWRHTIPFRNCRRSPL